MMVCEILNFRTGPNSFLGEPAGKGKNSINKELTVNEVDVIDEDADDVETVDSSSTIDRTHAVNDFGVQG